jgi:hypothetical protein
MGSLLRRYDITEEFMAIWLLNTAHLDQIPRDLMAMSGQMFTNQNGPARLKALSNWVPNIDT